MAPLLDRPPTPPVHASGELITERHAGSLICVGCGYAISAASPGPLPECPNCGGDSFREGSIFDRPTVVTSAIEGPVRTPGWMFEARSAIERPGPHLAFEERGRLRVVPLGHGWTRIGRSAASDLRLDDATVSRRHALIVLTAEDELRALDDRSLNGLFINGRRVDWAPLGDGDELEIGRYRLYILKT